METVPAPVGAEVTEFERTPEGYLELEWQYREVQGALALDFGNTVATTMSRADLEASVKEHVDNMNAERVAVEAEPIDIRRVDETFLRRLANLKTFDKEGTAYLKQLARPLWQEHLPQDDTPEANDKWEAFKSQYPEHMQINLEELRLLDGKMRVLSADEELQGRVQEIHGEHLEVMRAASAFVGADRKVDELSRKIVGLYQGAAVSNRSLTTAESRHVERLQAQQIQIRANRGKEITTPDMLDKVKVELRNRMDIQRRRDFEQGLVLTDSMKAIINELLPSLAQGRPALLVGETGGAKTALAEYISHQYFGVEPEFISGYGDVNSYQVMGKMSLRNEEGTTVSDFVPGPIIRAMEEGRPLILDEINAMPAEFLKRLNKIVQLRPGDTFVVQEDSGREVTIKPGFFIIGTANEKSKRYKGIEDLSVEFQNRFGANVIRVHYPDHDVVFGQPPVENTIIAKAALTDRSGQMVGGIDPKELERFVRACFITQQVFTGNFGKGFNDFVTSERIGDNKPGLDEAVLAPRTMVSLLEKVRDSYGKVSLDQVLRRFVNGIKSDNDKLQMTTILKGQFFLGEEKAE
ncbi:AAA family ATPase [Candidatus Microgenomates bacterium]|nr:AAA family ATPase [Candidatus Microgenomates bacterium]